MVVAQSLLTTFNMFLEMKDFKAMASDAQVAEGLYHSHLVKYAQAGENRLLALSATIIGDVPTE